MVLFSYDKQLSKLKQQITNVDKEENIYRDAVSKSQEMYRNLVNNYESDDKKAIELDIKKTMQAIVNPKFKTLLTIYGSKLNAMIKLLEKLEKIDPEKRILNRIKKFSLMGVVKND